MRRMPRLAAALAYRARSGAGFLLIEMLVYLAVLVLIAVSAVGTLLSLRGVFQQARANHKVVTAATSALERMVFEIESAAAVVVNASAFGSHPGSLTLSRGMNTRMFYLSGTQLRVKENGVDAGPLTPGNVSVENFVFTHYQNAHTEGVRVSLTLHVVDAATDRTETFSTMTLLRNSYE